MFGAVTAPDAAWGNLCPLGWAYPTCAENFQRLRPSRIERHSGMRKTLSMVGSVAVSGLLGWAGSHYGIMTGFLLGTVGTGLGMYCGRRLAEHLEA